MDNSSTIQLATQSRSIAQQLEGTRAALQANAPAFDVASRLSGAVSAVHELSMQAGGQGLIFAPGQLATPDIPVFLRANADTSVHLQNAAQQMSPSASAHAAQEQTIAYNRELEKLAQDWPRIVAQAMAAKGLQ